MFSYDAYEQQANNQSQYAETFLQAQLRTQQNNMMDVGPGDSTAIHFAASSLGQPNFMHHHMAPTTPSATDHLIFASEQLKASQLRNLAVRHRPDPGPCRPPQPMSSPLYQDDHLPRTLEHDTMPPDVGISPGTYLARPYVDSTSANLQPNLYYASNAPSAPGSMIWSSSAPEAPFPMTRENSTIGNPHAVNMERLASFRACDLSHESIILNSTAQLSMDGLTFESRDFSVFATGSKFETPHQDLSSASTATLLQPPNSTSTQMERSDSSTSTRSNASHRRARKAAERVIENQKAPIAPKPQSGSGSMVHLSDVSNVGVKSAAKPRKNRKPTPPKLFCDVCNDHKVSFKGGHELRRHKKANHLPFVEKYFCRDPAQVNIQSNLTVINPLHECKTCSSRKPYGTYYGAVAHLRRSHFSKKIARGRGKTPISSKGRDGGKDRNAWPPMRDLKLWLESVQVPNDQPPLARTNDETVESGIADSCANNVDGMANEDDNENARNASNADNIDLEDGVHLHLVGNMFVSVFNKYETAFADSPTVDTLAYPRPCDGFNDAGEVNDGENDYLGQDHSFQHYDFETCDPLDVFQRS